VRLYVLSVAICCVGYPAFLLGFALVAAPHQAEGSLIRDPYGDVVGSRLIAQPFSRPEYFWPRPSACDYKADAAGGSNLSPANPEIAVRANDIIKRYRLPSDARIPAELVTASGSGLDPHIARPAALVQAPRVAAARGLSLADVQRLIDAHHDSPALAAFGGEPLVNVLELNLALDTLKK
jgi:K+-transporting ATPase ATPase C chain